MAHYFIGHVLLFLIRSLGSDVNRMDLKLVRMVSLFSIHMVMSWVERLTTVFSIAARARQRRYFSWQQPTLTAPSP